MAKVRNDNFPQHHLQQGHYGDLSLDELPDASGYPSGSVMVWQDGEWEIGDGGGGGEGAHTHTQYLTNTAGAHEVLNVIVLSGTSQVINLADGNVADITLTDDCDVEITGAVAGFGCWLTILARQDDTGGWCLNLPDSVHLPGDGDLMIDDNPEHVTKLNLYTVNGGEDWFAFVENVVSGSGGSGSVSADGIWDAKGDLAVGLGSNSADNLPVGIDGQVLVADSGETLGVKWDTGGASALDDLSDVNAPTPADGDVLTWDSDTSEWINAESTGGAGGSSDVTEWTTYTPTLSATTTPPTLGSSTLTGRYKYIAYKTLAVEINLTITTGGAWNAGSGEWTFTLPAGVTSGPQNQAITGHILDSGTKRFVVSGLITASGNLVSVMAVSDATGTFTVQHNVPITWATGDSIHLSGIVEVTSGTGGSVATGTAGQLVNTIVYRASNQNVAGSDTATDVSFSNEEEDTHGVWDVGTPTKFIIPSSLNGRRAIIQGQVEWTASTSGNHRQIWIDKAGTAIAQVRVPDQSTAVQVVQQVTTKVLTLATGDEYKLVMRTDTTGIGAIGGQHSTWMGLYLLDGGIGSTSVPMFDLLNSQKSSADTPDDEFSSGTLDPKWTVVAGTTGTFDRTATSSRAIYDLTSRPGWLISQVGPGTTQRFDIRQDYTLPDGASIVVAVAPGTSFDGTPGLAANERQTVLALNSDDSQSDAGSTRTEFFAVEADADSWDVQSIATGASASTAATIGSLARSGHLIYLRVSRHGLVYYLSFSNDGSTWINMGSQTFAAAHTNIWISDRAFATNANPIPATAWAWVRQGTNDYDPWTPTVSVGTDHKVSVSSNDTTPDYLVSKISGSGSISTYEYNNAGNEVLVISGSGNVIAYPRNTPIIIPSLALGDRVPASPGSYDEEFDGAADTLPANWAWTSAPTGSDLWSLNSRWASLLTVEGPGNTAYTLKRTSFTPAATFGLWAKLHASPFASADQVGVRMYVSDSGETNWRGMDWRATGARAAGIRGLQKTGGGESVWGTEITNMHQGGSTCYVGITRDGSNNLKAWYGRDGISWELYNGATAHTFTIDHIIFTFKTPNAQPSLMGVDWVRYRADNDFPRP